MVGDESQSYSSSVIPGAITALLREAFRSPRQADVALSGFRPGVVVGRFELVRRLGRGGFGVVFEALDRTLGRVVAFKAVRMAGDVDVNAEMLLREAEAAAQLSHPNIVVLHDLGQCEHGPYLVMELLRGRTLGQRLADGPVPVPEALLIALEMAKGVAHAHARGVVHRDLKPGNVFLCDDGQVKVLDFGMARMFGRPKVDGGTIDYMAPEQRRGEPEDERTDVFALGVMLHEMLVGVRPAVDDRAPAVREGPPALAAAVGGELSRLVVRMLAPDSAGRPRDGREVLASLKAAERGLRVGSTLPPARTRSRVRALLVAVAMAAAAALVVSRIHPESRPPAPAVASAPPIAAPAQAPTPESPRASAPDAPPRPAPAPALVTVNRRPAGNAAPGPASKQTIAPRPSPAPAPPAVRYCRGGIDSVPTPRPESGEGVLVLIADPFAEVFVDGQPFGDTPTECALSAGVHAARAAHPRYGAREARVEIRAGERTRFSADFLGGP
jgi:serine/threonine protein kinase